MKTTKIIIHYSNSTIYYLLPLIGFPPHLPTSAHLLGILAIRSRICFKVILSHSS
ncbi:uncharacterized protein LY89DRAFT_415683, partial [Mollisia scopiformis]